LILLLPLRRGRLGGGFTSEKKVEVSTSTF